MKRHFSTRSTVRPLFLIGLFAGIALPPSALAASVSLATQPLATSTTSTVRPNVMLVLDNSGSMDWDHMPDDSSDGGSASTFSYGYYGLRSSQCNQVYYDPTLTYQPPVDATGTNYGNSSFTGAWTNGFNTGAGTVNLDSGFRASQSLGGDSTGGPAYYYNYSGTQTTQLQKDYNSTTNTFYNECHSAQNASPGQDLFTKVSLSSTAIATTATIVVSGTTSTSVSSIKIDGVELMSGTSIASTSSTALANDIAAKITLSGYSASAGGTGTITISGLAATAKTITITKSGTMTLSPTIFPAANATNLTNFANWYSFYRTRMLMMKTATGRAFSALTDKYRVGLSKFSSSTPVVNVDTFLNTQRSTWYSTLYAVTTSGSTPTRTALSNAGRYYAGKLGTTDPLQYSCQQNFTILSTDGYWNTGDGYKMDGTTLMDNEDSAVGRPMYDGATVASTWTNIYTRSSYSASTSGCSGGKRRLKTQPQIGSCTVTTSGASCTPASWSNNGTATYSGTCVNSVLLPSPNPTTAQLQSSTQDTIGGSSNSLADVAMYYYQTDLRDNTLWSNCTGSAGVDVCDNNVFTSSTDNNMKQHMTTFTLGLGASGWMKYSSSYLTDTSGDFVAVKLGSVADSTATPPVCSWQANGTTCNWPIPGMSGGNGFIANVDDLWHAAVNGRGAYFSATNPATLSAGLSNALSGINAREGSAAAAATSSLNPVAGNNFAYVASYTTVKWKGNLEARGVNIDTGVVSENATWCVENVTSGTCAAPSSVVIDTSGATSAYYCVTPNSVICPNGLLNGTDCMVPVATACTGTMNALVSDAADTRTIYTANSTGTALIPFDTAYRAANAGYFSAAHIGTLTQWSTLTATQQAAAEGDNLINFLRGQHGHEDRTTNLPADRLYRFREAVLGDALESQPAFMGAPVFNFPYPGYSEFKTAQATRGGNVYIGANDGMMHAFAADTGVERWAFVPSMVIPNMWKLADTDYANRHTNFVNGSVVVSDVCASACTNAASAVWKTILVAGLNGGERGYYALDVTNPSVPSLLWEFTPQSGIGSHRDDDVGYGFGPPIVTRKADGTWVVLVTSGYNNTSGTGTGGEFLFVLDPITGAIISKIPTGVGDTTTPGGLAKITAWNNEPGGNTAGYVYGGDLQGNLWRFDINSTAALTSPGSGTGSVMKFATLFSDAGGTLPQPVTTAPVLAQYLGKRIIIVGTGKYLETGDLITTQTQSYYSIKDDEATATLVNPRATLARQTLVNDPTTGTRTSTGTAPNWSTSRGCYADFPDTGERENVDSLLVQGIVLVPTIVPSNTACSPGGYGWLNYFNYRTCSAAAIRSDATIVGINVVYISGNPIVSWVTDRDPTPRQPGIQPTFPSSVSGFTGKHVIWRELTPQ